MGADISGIDVTHGVSRDPRCRSAAVDSVQIGRIGNKGAQRTVNGAADHDAAQLARLRSGRLVATCRLISERGADIKRIVRPDKDRAWLAKLMPGGDEIAVLIENLDATVATIGNIDTPERAANKNVVRIIEIAGSRSFMSPGLDEPAVLGKFNDTAIIRLIRRMAIGDKNIAIGRHRDTGRTIESIRAAAADAHLAKHHQNPAVLVELEDFLTKHDASGIACRHAEHGVAVINIADPQIAVPVYSKAVRIAKHAGAEGLEQLAGGIKLQDWWIGLAATNAGGAAGRHGVETAMENPDVAVAMDMHADDFAPAAAIHAWGQGRPVLHKAIGIGEVGWLGKLRLLGACSRCQAGHEHPGEKDHTGLHCRHHRKPPRKLCSRCIAIVEQILPTSSRAMAARSPADVVSFCCRMPSDLELREAFMRYSVSASVAVLAVALASPANAQLEDKPVRMEKAPFHIPV